MTKNIIVLFHSGYGHTAKVADFITQGANQVEGINAKALSVENISETIWTELDSADAIIFGSPTYMGSVSGKFKDFMDSTSKRWFTQAWKNKIAAGFTNSASLSGDKLGTLTQLAIFAAQHSMIWVGADVMPNFNGMNRLGSFLGLMTQADGDKPADIAPPQADLQTAELFGKRVAEITKKFSL